MKRGRQGYPQPSRQIDALTAMDAPHYLRHGRERSVREEMAKQEHDP